MRVSVRKVWSQNGLSMHPGMELKKSHSESRGLLLMLIQEKYKTTGTWSDLAHIGMLQINLGREKQAFETWITKVKTSPASMLDKQWDSWPLSTRVLNAGRILKIFSRLALQLKVRPRYRAKNYSAFQMLADALFLGAKGHFASKRWPEAIAKLTEFTKVFVKDRRRPEGFFVLAKSYHNNANHPESIETLITLVNSYPNNSVERQALLYGGDWSIPMAYEEQTIFFYQRFVNKYKRHTRIPEVRRVLADLYVGREIYGSATRIYQAQSEDSRVSRSERLQSALAVMDLESRHGEIRHAYWGVRQAKELARGNSDVLATVYSFETKVAARNKNYKKVRQLESKLNRLEKIIVRFEKPLVRLVSF